MIATIPKQFSVLSNQSLVFDPISANFIADQNQSWNLVVCGRITLSWNSFIIRSRFFSLCVLGFLFCDLRIATASCGDYLHGHGMTYHRNPELGESNNSDPVPRCTGPHCQRNEHPPAAPGRSIELTLSNDAILMKLTVHLCGENDSHFRPSCQNLNGEEPADRVFRPPRVT
jgi:hypothetical protein